MEIKLKAKIFNSLADDYLFDEKYEDFFQYNGSGVPLAQSFIFELYTLTDEGIQEIDDTYGNSFSELGIDNIKEFDNLKDFFLRKQILIKRTIPTTITDRSE